MSNFDYYLEARDLISRLKSEGDDESASKLRSAMEGGATGTEILMALRFHLAEIIKNIPLRDETRIQASRLLVEIIDALE